MNKQRSELHVHTNMSAMDGINTAEEYINAATEHGLSAIAITDNGSVQAFPEAYNAWKSVNEKIKLIYGIELYMVLDENNPLNPFHTSILVKNKKGLINLYKLISIASREYFEKMWITSKDEIEKYRDGLLIGSGCENGELYDAISTAKSMDALLKIAGFYDYLEVVPICNFEYFIKWGYAETKNDLIKINRKIVELGEMTGKPVVAVSDAYYVNKKYALCRKVLFRSQGYKNYNEQPDLSVKTTEELLDEFEYLGEKKAYEIVVENPNRIADMVDDPFPPFELNAHYEAYVEKFKNLVAEKTVEKYGKNIHKRMKDRIDWELSMICRNELSVYNFMIGTELVGRAKKNGWTVGNRGSVASSLIAHLLGIADINPLEAHYHCSKCHYVEFHDKFSCGVDMEDKVCECGTKLEKDGFTIPPECFLGTDGSTVADIDYNFAPEYQKEAFEHLEKALNTTIVRGGTIRTIPYNAARNMICDYSVNENILFSKAEREELADKITRIKLSDGKYPGKMIVVPTGKEIYDYTPIRYNEFEDGKWRITHFNSCYSSASYSFHKVLNHIDVLSHDDPSMIRKLEKLTNVTVKNIPLDDKETMQLFAESKTLGISEFSTSFVRERMMSKVHPDSFDDLIRISGMSHGTEVWTDNAEKLIDEGRDVSEVVSCRDDVMLALIAGGIEREEAYKISVQIRKGKGLTEEQYAALLGKGFEKWKLDSWNKILYAFPRAHAASYVLYAYRMAYYKAHYPLEFYCAYFSTYAENFDADLLINHASSLRQKIREAKCNLKNTDISELIMMEVCQEMYDKGYDFTVHNISNAIKEFIIENGKIAPVLRDIF